MNYFIAYKGGELNIKATMLNMYHHANYRPINFTPA